MNTNAVLEEIWAVKDRLAAEAGGDIHVFCQQLRAWERDEMPQGFKLRAARPAVWAPTDEDTLVLREEPAPRDAAKPE